MPTYKQEVIDDYTYVQDHWIKPKSMLNETIKTLRLGYYLKSEYFTQFNIMNKINSRVLQNHNNINSGQMCYLIASVIVD